MAALGVSFARGPCGACARVVLTRHASVPCNTCDWLVCAPWCRRRGSMCGWVAGRRPSRRSPHRWHSTCWDMQAADAVAVNWRGCMRWQEHEWQHRMLPAEARVAHPDASLHECRLGARSPGRAARHAVARGAVHDQV
eukprot:355986-Chlamydomonas_euryale.AAC.5